MLVVREKVVYLEIDPTIAGNDTQNATLRTTIEDGFILGAEIHSNWQQSTSPTNILLFGIDDDSGVPVSRMTHINHWKRREGGGFNESFKPLMFKGNGRTLTFKLNSKEPLTQKIYAHVILFYKIEAEKC